MLLIVGALILSIALVRIAYVCKCIYDGRKCMTSSFVTKKTTVKTLAVAGSGGHTTELLRVMETLKAAYTPRIYLVAQTDKISAAKIHDVEKRNDRDANFSIHYIPRSREVKQSWLSTIFSTLYSCFYTFPLVWIKRPDLVLVNGPGTCVPICLAAFILTLSGVKKVSIIYIESICRVKKLSMSGKILYFFADQFLVQWPDLKERYPLVHYMGRVV